MRGRPDRPPQERMKKARRMAGLFHAGSDIGEPSVLPAFHHLELAPDHRIDGRGIARDVDVANEVEGPLLHLELDVDRLVLGVQSGARFDAGEEEAAQDLRNASMTQSDVDAVAELGQARQTLEEQISRIIIGQRRVSLGDIQV